MGQRTVRITARIWREDDQYVAQAVEVDIASSGDTPEESLDMLREAVAAYFEEAGVPEELHSDACAGTGAGSW